jgi:2-polyprenyl-6-methoxyphenol hydroxylase-like FAD-dependent oxidoreductase
VKICVAITCRWGSSPPGWKGKISHKGGKNDGPSAGCIEGEKKFSADYGVGCDGANSKIRRSLFGDWNFPGFTWEQLALRTYIPCRCGIVNLKVYYPFEKFGVIDVQFIVDPVHWHMVAHISKDGMY